MRSFAKLEDTTTRPTQTSIIFREQGDPTNTWHVYEPWTNTGNTDEVVEALNDREQQRHDRTRPT